MLLSNVMPELTEEERKCKGMYTVSYFDENVQCLVAAKYCSIYAFMVKNNIPLDTLDFVSSVFYMNNKFEIATNKGIVVIYC